MKKTLEEVIEELAKLIEKSKVAIETLEEEISKLKIEEIPDYINKTATLSFSLH